MIISQNYSISQWKKLIFKLFATLGFFPIGVFGARCDNKYSIGLEVSAAVRLIFKIAGIAEE